jgi:hypothetical protein
VSVALTLGPLKAAGFDVQRSGVTWLREDGDECRPNQIIGYCHVSLEPTGLQALAARPFANERTLQVAFAPRIGGRLRIPEPATSGGHLNVLGILDWRADDIVARLEPADEGEGTDQTAELRLLMLSGRRMAWAVDVDFGLIPGWHSLARGWWEAPDDGIRTLISLGFCDASGLVRGDRSGFAEMFEACTASSQMVHVSEHPATPCAPFLVEQFMRSRGEREAIAEDIGQALGASSASATPQDLVFGAALTVQLTHCPMRETFDVLTRTGLQSVGPAEAVLLSLGAEPRSILRHRTLGYRLHVLAHDLRAAGPATKAWLRSAFRQESRTLDDIRADYRMLIQTVGATTGARFFIINRMSSAGVEDLVSYAAFDEPMGDALASISAKEMNIMLDDLADEFDIEIIDMDALAAEFGGAAHLPDGVHPSAMLQTRLRAEILQRLATTAG